MTLVKNPPAKAGVTGDTGSIPGSGRSPGGGTSNQRQYSCLEKVLWTEDPDGLQSRSHKLSDVTEQKRTRYT